MSLRHAWPALLGGVAVLLLGWSELDLVGGPGADPSWHAALHMAASERLDFGRDLVYTYGPLGFLKVPEFWVQRTGALAVLYTTLTRLALLTVAFAVARRSFGLPLAVLVLLVVSAELQDPVVPLAFAGAVWLVAGAGDARPRLLVAIGLGALGGFEVLGKLNTGATVLALAVVAVLFAAGRERVRLLAALAASATIVALAGWLATGQSLSAIPDFAENSASIVSGFSAAMVLDGSAWQYTAVFLTIALGGWAIWGATASQPRRGRLGVAALWAVLSWLAFKQGFVRHSDSHAAFAFGTLLAALAVVPWARRGRTTALLVMLVPLLALVATTNQRITDIVDPVSRVDAAVDDLEPLVSRSEREQLVARTLSAVRAVDVLDDQTLSLLEGRTVHVLPVETAMIAAYDLRWQPLPVFQDYQAYTSSLDELNADALLGDDAPERLLLAADEPVDKRVAAWDPPAQHRALLCRYVPLRVQDERWIVLRRAENRCGAPRLVETELVGWNQPAPVPPPSAPDRMMFMRISGAEVHGLERLRALLFKAHIRYVDVNGRRDGRRFVPGTAAGGLLLHAPDSVDLPFPFHLAPAPASVALARAGDPPAGDEELRFEFYEVAVAP